MFNLNRILVFRLFVVAVLCLCFLVMVDAKSSSGGDPGCSGMIYSFFHSTASFFERVGFRLTIDSIPKPLLQLLLPLHGKIITTLLYSINIVRLSLGSVKNPNLDRQVKIVELDLQKLKAVEYILDEELEKSVLSIYESAKDIASLEKYVTGLIYISRQLVGGYVDHEGKVRRLIKDTQDEYSKGWLIGIAESIFDAFGGDRDELEISKRVKPLMETLRWTSRKICILKGWEAFMRLALDHAKMNQDLHIKLDTILSKCEVHVDS